VSYPISQNPAGPTLVAFAGLIAAITAGYAYLTPLTGVNDTAGPLLVIAAGLALIAGGLLLRAVSGRGVRMTLRVLVLLALVGTCFAGLLLHQ